MPFHYLPTSSPVVRAVIHAINAGTLPATQLFGDHEIPELHIATYEWEDGTYMAVGIERTVLFYPK